MGIDEDTHTMIVQDDMTGHQKETTTLKAERDALRKEIEDLKSIKSRSTNNIFSDTKDQSIHSFKSGKSSKSKGSSMAVPETYSSPIVSSSFVSSDVNTPQYSLTHLK